MTKNLTLGDRYQFTENDPEEPLSEEKNARLQELAGIIARLLKKFPNIIIDEIKSEPIYIQLLTNPNFLDHKQLALLTPIKSNYEEVYRVLKKQSRVIIDHIGSVIDFTEGLGLTDDALSESEKQLKVHEVLQGLVTLTRNKLLEVVTANVIQTSIDESQTDKESRTHISPKELRKHIIKISEQITEGNIVRKDAIIHLLIETGIISKIPDKKENITRTNKIKKIIKKYFGTITKRNETQLIEELNEINYTEEQKEKLRTTINSSLHEATEIFKKLAENIKAIVRKMAINGDFNLENNTITIPEMTTSVTNMGAFDMLEKLFKSGLSKKKSNQVEIRDLNDIQAILYIAFLLLKWELNPAHADALKEKNRVLEASFEELVNIDNPQSTHSKMLKFKNGEFIDTRIKQSEEIYIATVKVNEEEKEIRLKRDWGNIKTSDSIWRKLTAEYTDKSIEDILDHLRGRFITFGINANDMINNPKTQEIMEALIKKHGKLLNLTYSNKKKEELGEGEFTIVKPKKNATFPKYALSGRINGVKVEFQYLPQDLYEAEQAIDSPLSHKLYKEILELKLLRLLTPESISPILHIAAKKRIEELNKIRDKAIKSLLSMRGNIKP